jgi:hypothetical protein
MNTEKPLPQMAAMLPIARLLALVLPEKVFSENLTHAEAEPVALLEYMVECTTE